MVLDEGNGISAIVLCIQHHVGGAELAPVVLVDCVADTVAELEVEGGTCGYTVDGGSLYPVLDGLCTVPVFSDGESGFGRGVVVAGVGGAVALHHIVAEAFVAKVVEQEVEVRLDAAVDIGGLVVDVATSVPAFAGIVVRRNADALLVGPCPRLTVVVVRTDVCGEHVERLAIIGLFGEVDPRTSGSEIVAVVDDHVGNDAGSLFTVCGNHGAQLVFGAKTAVMVVIVDGHVSHDIVGGIAVSGLRHPNEAEILGELIALLLEIAPLGIAVAVPVEALKHDTVVLRRPALCSHLSGEALCSSKKQKRGE